MQSLDSKPSAVHREIDAAFIDGTCHESACVRVFHEMAGQPTRHTPTVIPDDEVRLRARLIIEEVQEALESMFDGPEAASMAAAFRSLLVDIRTATVCVDLPNLARELTDINYVTTGTFVQMGLPKEALFDCVNAANHAKVRDGAILKGSKVQKPPGWIPPDVASILVEHGWQK